MGLGLALSPDLIIGGVDWTSPTGQRVAGPLRIGFGIGLLLGAPSSRFPRVIRASGMLVVAAGLVILLLPDELWKSLTEAILLSPPAPLSIIGSLPNFAVAAALFYAAKPESAVSP